MGGPINGWALDSCWNISGHVSRWNHITCCLPGEPAGIAAAGIPAYSAAHYRGPEVATSAPSSRRLRFDSFEVDVHSGEVWKNGARIRLQGQPFQVLRLLLERHGEIVTRD